MKVKDGWRMPKDNPRQCVTCHLAFDLDEDMVHCHSLEHARFLDSKRRQAVFEREFLAQGWIELLRYEGLVDPEFNCPQWLGGKIEYRFENGKAKQWYLREAYLFHVVADEWDCEWRQYNTGLMSCISIRGRRTF
jgi:hypothetical protein